MLTADTITDEQIRELARSRALSKSKPTRMAILGVALGNGARYTLNGYTWTQADARRYCAEILNARAQEDK